MSDSLTCYTIKVKGNTSVKTGRFPVICLQIKGKKLIQDISKAFILKYKI